MTAEGYDKGVAAEALAASYLEGLGWTVLGARVRTGAGELDLILTKGPETQAELVFVEVKLRDTLEAAAYAITPRAQARLYGAAEAWLAKWQGPEFVSMRFDAVLVTPQGMVKHLENVISAG